MEEIATVTLTFNIVHPHALYDAAVKAYMTTGGGRSKTVARSFLGTGKHPNLQACLVEVICDQDPVGLFEPTY